MSLQDVFGSSALSRNAYELAYRHSWDKTVSEFSGLIERVLSEETSQR